MWRYYGNLVLGVPKHIWKATDNFLTAIAFGVTIVVGLSPDWLKWIDTTASGIDRTWAFLPIGLLVIYGLMEANYANVKAEAKREAPDPEALADELDAFVAASKARIPQAPPFSSRLVFDDPTTYARLNAEHRAKVNAVRAEAMGDYHDRYKAAVVAVLDHDLAARSLARKAQHLGEVEELVKALKGEEWDAGEG